MILLASMRKSVIARWEEGLLGHFPVSLSRNMISLKESLASIKPQTLLLDYELPGLEGKKGIAELGMKCTETNIIVFIPDITEEIEWSVYTAGAKGCCRDDMDPNQIRYVIEVIGRGELWIRRTLTHYMLNELVVITQEKNRIALAANDLLRNLTRREYEIAMLVGQGENNKRIARKLAITERTVKAHLSEIFRKLDITDRLNLALAIKDTIGSTDIFQANTVSRQ